MVALLSGVMGIYWFRETKAISQKFRQMSTARRDLLQEKELDFVGEERYFYLPGCSISMTRQYHASYRSF
jgi:hypothetical protein